MSVINNASTNANVLFTPASSEMKFLPEGPFDLGRGRFSWVAIQHGASARFGSLNIFDTTTGQNQSYVLPGRPGFARPTDDPNKFVVGAERELGLFDIQTLTWTAICSGIDSHVENTIINDGTLWRDNLIFGTKDLEFKTKKAGLYLFRGRDRRLFQLRDDQICSNGKAVVESTGGRLSLLDIDTPTRKVVRYPLDLDAGTIGSPETVLELSDAIGFPDGMTLTPDKQRAIISFYNPEEAEYGLTQQFHLADGKLEFSWKTPNSPQATCPLLLPMASGEVRIVITTAVEHMSHDRQVRSSNSGSLFIATTPFQASDFFTRDPHATHFPLRVLA